MKNKTWLWLIFIVLFVALVIWWLTSDAFADLPLGRFLRPLANKSGG